LLSDYVNFGGKFVFLEYYDDLSSWGGPAGVGGIVLQQYYNLTTDIAKEIVEWLTDFKNPVVGTFYDLSHTFKVVSATGVDLSYELNYGDITGAQAAVIYQGGTRPTVQIKGGSPTGNFTQASGTIGIGDAPSNNFESTSG